MMRFALLFAVTFGLILAFTWLLVFCRRRRSGSGHAVTTMCQHTGGPTCGNCRDEKVKGPAHDLRITGKPCRLSEMESAHEVGVPAPPCPPDQPDHSSTTGRTQG
jgi:hypothetical protein